jgi:signal transduction histidine kinase
MDEFTRTHVFYAVFLQKKKGTGLGMAMVKRIVDEYQGTIGVASVPGAGTRIDIMIEGVVRH